MGRPSRHVRDAERYATDVVAGKIEACKWVKAACQRHLADRAKESADFPFEFSEFKADKICKFAELLPHIEGPKANQRFILEPWQKFILCCVFGWVHKSTQKRRFRRVYIEVPRGNGKSFLSSAVALYALAADGESGAQVYSAATTRDQAKVVFKVAQHMARRCDGYRQTFGIQVNAHNLNQERTASKFEPLSADAQTLDGLNIHVAIVDELHAHKTRDVYDVLATGTGKRDQSLLWSITTAGSNRAGICYDQRIYVTKILDGVFSDDSYFGIIYTVDDGDDWTDPKIWQKANPNWGVSVDAASVSQEARKAMQLASAQPAFQAKHLNIWVNADHAWMNMHKFEACADPNLSDVTFEGQPCIEGLDLASKLDLLAKFRIFWRDIGDSATQQTKRHYYAFGDYWTPQRQLEESTNSQYPGWAREGRLHVCPGETNDYDVVEQAIREDAKRFQVIEVAHDPYQAVEIVNHLQEDGILMVEIPQRTTHLSEPMKELEAAVYDGRFHFDGDPILTWAVSNVVCHLDKNDNLFPTKERLENKIDPATALLTGLNRVMAQPIAPMSAQVEVW